MDLTIFFSPVPESVYDGIDSSSSFFKTVNIFGDKMPDYRGARIAMFGINVNTAEEPLNGADEIRRKLYRLKKGKGGARIVDLGNLNPGLDAEEAYVRVSEVCRML